MCWGAATARAIGTFPARLAGHVINRIVAPQSGQQMKIPAKPLVQGLVQGIITEPGVRDQQDRALLKYFGNGKNHFHRLIDFGFKLKSRFFHPPGLDGFFHMIEAITQGKTGPSALHRFQKPHHDDILRPRIFGLVLFGGMVEDPGASEDFFPGLGVDGIIKQQKKPVAG